MRLRYSGRMPVRWPGWLCAGVLVLLANAALAAGPAGGAPPQAADAVQRGRLALEDGFFTLADEAFLAALSSVDMQDPEAENDAAAAAHYILLSHFQQQRFEALADDLSRFVAQGLLKADGDAYWRGMLFYGESQWKAVLPVLEYFESRSGRKSIYAARGLRLKALAHFKAGDPAAAAAVFAVLDGIYKGPVERAYNRMDWGRVLLLKGDTAAAQEVWAPLTGSGTNLPAGLVAEACFQAGRVHLLTGGVARAALLLQPLADNVELDETLRVNAVFALADARLQAAEAAAGAELLTRTIPLIQNPRLRKEASVRLARYLFTSGRLEEAAVQVRAFIGSNPNDPDSAALQDELGEALLKAERYAEADDVFQKYLEAFGDATGIALRGRGLALAGLARYAEAALLFERAAALPGDAVLTADNLYRAGDCYFLNQQYRKALEVYERLMATLDSGSALESRVLLQCAASLAALGDTGAAIGKFETVARLYPESEEAANALLGIGELHLENGRYEESDLAFGRAMSAYPSGSFFWRAIHGRGMARYHLWAPNAIEDFEKIASSSDDAAMAEHAHFMKAMCLYRLGRDEQALAVCRDFRKRFPASEWAAPVHFWIARFEYNAGHDEQAEAEFLAFVDKYPAHDLSAQGLLRAGLAAARRQQYLLAIELLGRLTRIYPQSDLLAEARFHQAEAMAQLGRFAAAILVYEEVINRYPDQELAGMALGRKGDCQFTLGADDPARYEEAVLSYLAVLEMPGIRLDHALQAAYKLGLTYEKLGRTEEALTQYYSRVMLPFLVEKEKGGIPGEAARVWFSRAARGAAAIVEGRKDWRQLVRILERAVSADVEFSGEARTRMKAVKAEYWWMFY